jgi:hypothetical protein
MTRVKAIHPPANFSVGKLAAETDRNHRHSKKHPPAAKPAGGFNFSCGHRNHRLFQGAKISSMENIKQPTNPQIEEAQKEMNDAEDALMDAGFSWDHWKLIRSYILHAILVRELSTFQAIKDIADQNLDASETKF